MKFKFILLFFFFILVLTHTAQEQEIKKGNVIFIHPDGTSLATFNAARLLYYGPDGFLNWDKLPRIGLYRGHVKNALAASSHSGATIHAYGTKVIKDSYGKDGKKPVTSRAGNNISIMHEAIKSGLRTGIVNSGTIVEPGTGAFVAQSDSRDNYEDITEQIIKSGLDVIFCGGEEWLIPNNEIGFYGKVGKRKDGQNLLKWAEENGYKVIYTKDELNNLPKDTEKVIGIFAFADTYNAKSEEELKEAGLPNYNPNAPTVAEMTEKAIEILSNSDKNFFLVTEEEGTDNFGNNTNANGMLEALKRADDAIKAALDFYHENPNTLIITAADSEAGGMEVLGEPESVFPPNKILPAKDRHGYSLDGSTGSETLPFISQPDKNGNRFPFAICWSTTYDAVGANLIRGIGLNSFLINGNMDNTDVYKVMYSALFGKLLE